MSNRPRMALLGLVVTLGAASSVSPVLAAASTLQSAVLKTSEVPSAFLHPHVKAYASFKCTSTYCPMQVPVIRAKTLGYSSCRVPTSFKLPNVGLKQGVIEAFDTRTPIADLSVCDWRFGSSSGAHSAYLYETKWPKAMAKIKTSSLFKVALGDEALGIAPYKASKTHKKTKSSRTANSGKTGKNKKSPVGHPVNVPKIFKSVVRTGNTITEVYVVNPPASFGKSSLMHLAALVNSRVR